MKRALLASLVMIAIASAAAGQTANRKPADTEQDKAVLLGLADELTSIKMKRDVAALDRLLADDYIFTNPAGLFVDKAAYLEGARIDTAAYESITNTDKVVKVYGDAAVVAGLTTVKGRYDGHDIGGQFRFTDMFVRRQGRWQCVAIHLTRTAQ